MAEIWVMGEDNPKLDTGWTEEADAKSSAEYHFEAAAGKGRFTTEWKLSKFREEKEAGRQYLYRNDPERGHPEPYMNTGWCVQPIEIREAKRKN